MMCSVLRRRLLVGGSVMLLWPALALPVAAQSKQTVPPKKTAAKPAVPPAANQATISGRVTNPAADREVTLEGGTLVAPIVTKLNPDNTFQLTPALNAPGSARLMIGSEYTEVWLTPGDQLALTLDANRFDESLKYTGKGAVVNSFRAAEVLREEAIGNARRRAMSAPPARYAAWADSLHQVQTERLAKALPGKSASETSFRNWQQAAYDYNWGYGRMAYANAHHLPPTDPYFDFLKDPALALDRPAPTGVEVYGYFLADATRHQLRLSGKAGTDAELYQVLRANRTLAPDRRHSLMVSVASDALQEGTASWAELDSIQRWATTDKELPAKARRYIGDMWSNLQLTRPGQPAPDFAAVTEDGKPFTWADVRGKLVYVDFWASWCGPCRAEMPAAEKLHAALHDRAGEIVFLNISVDAADKTDKWRQAMKDSHVEGLNVNAPGNGQWDSPALKAYGIRAIPRYLLVGPDGRILDGNAPRPSGGAEAAIRAALAKK